jgi:hypothetical protein
MQISEDEGEEEEQEEGQERWRFYTTSGDGKAK